MVNDVAFSPDGGAIATVSADYTARIWDTQTGRELATLPGSAWMGQVDWSSDGEYVAATTDTKQTVFLYRVTGRHHVQRRLHGNDSHILRVASHPRLEQFATCHQELVTWKASDPRPSPRRLGTETRMGTALAYSPNGSLLATGSWINYGSRDSRIMVRDSNTGEVRTHFPARGSPRGGLRPNGEAACERRRGREPCRVGSPDRPPCPPVAWVAPSGQSTFLMAVHDWSPTAVTRHFSATSTPVTWNGRSLFKGGVRRFVADSERNRLVVAFQSGAIGSVSLPELTPDHR